MDELMTPPRFAPDGKPHLVYGRHTVRNADGSVAVQGEWMRNAIANEGEAEVLNVLLLGSQAARANYYLELLAATPVAASTMASVTELVAATETGYGRATIAAADWAALSGTQPTTTTAAEKVFGPNTKGSDWAAITYVALVTTSTGTGGKFILFVALSGSTLVHNTQSFEYTLTASMT